MMEKVVNEYGVKVDYEAAVNLMDDEIREDLHLKLAGKSNQEFFETYAKAHKEKFGEEFELAKENPVY